MIEKFEPALWGYLYDFSLTFARFMALAEYLKSIGDPRSQDVYEVGILDHPVGVEDDERVVVPVHHGGWWQLLRLPKHYLARILPGTAQRQRAGGYGRTHHAAYFMTKHADRAWREREWSKPDRVAAMLDEWDGGPQRTEPNPALLDAGEPEVVGGEEAFDECRVNLILMQFGTTFVQLIGRKTFFGKGPRVESFEEYQSLYEQGEDMGHNPRSSIIDAIESVADCHHLPQWMAELRQFNPGRFEWVMNFLVEHEDQYPGVVARVQEVVPYTPRRKKTTKRPRRKG